MKRSIFLFVALLYPAASFSLTGQHIARQRAGPRSSSSSSSSSGSGSGSSSSSTSIPLRMSAADHVPLDRRSVLSILPAAASFLILSSPTIAAADGGSSAAKPKVVVVGGAGWVGAHVDQILLDQGCEVVSVSRSSPAVQADKIKAILGTSLPAIDHQSLDASKDDLSAVFRGASAVISCVGALPGSSSQRAGNGAVNVRIADAAKAAGIDKFVYISVASEVANSPAKFLIGDYFKGKAEAEAAVLKDYGDAALVLKPGFIAGGPPGELRPPGPPGMTPVPVEAVAKAAVAGALGNLKGTIDGNKAIVNSASS
jgi:uncharacterized protein YbjT (DUF2867 family)